ncbi:hypothetical protein RHGRI_001119 [Rhododendron griersonianum]|uniref:Uncharacterized protein n=1 Tax=Rhododendron griersonianum TaxID=479676 RepID=A0AAV6LM51_9ERIC|nr:hypothetical protein RHGRI_001119 [Rhododendron griersonianum]
MNYLIVLSASVAVLLSIALFPLLSTNYLWNLRGPSSSSSSSLVADLFVTNGFIYTSDSSLPVADSMAIRAGRVLRVGNYSSLQSQKGLQFMTTDNMFAAALTCPLCWMPPVNLTSHPWKLPQLL